MGTTIGPTGSKTSRSLRKAGHGRVRVVTAVLELSTDGGVLAAFVNGT